MLWLNAILATMLALVVGFTLINQEDSNTELPSSDNNQNNTTVTNDTASNDTSNHTDNTSDNTDNQANSQSDNNKFTGWDKDLKQCPEVKINQDSNFTPYLQAMTDSSVWVSWKSEINSGSVVEYSTSPCAFSNKTAKTASGSAEFMTLAYFYNTVKLQGLQPDQRYYYRVKSGNKVSGIYRFATAPKNNDQRKIRFMVIGDHQSTLDQRYKKLVETAKNTVEKKYGMPIEQAIDFVLNDGDQVQTGGIIEEWDHMHFRQSAPISANVPIQMTLGNHEYWGDPTVKNYRTALKAETLNYAGIQGAEDETYYAHQQGSVLVIHLNTNVDTNKRAEKSREAQTAWLKKVIETAKNDPNISFITSVMHHPYNTETQELEADTFNNVWINILASTDKYMMTIAGHHHLYSRGQITDKPVYYMISGGTGGALSAQWFGDPYSKFVNKDEVQKTIANWAWQIVEIDPKEKTMTVESYAESHPAVFTLTRRLGYNSRLIDKFTRKLGQIKPNKPTITLLANQQQVDLSQDYTFSSSEFNSSQPNAQLNTTQFQIARDSSFNNVQVDKITHFEDFYGDTGAPEYKPIDLHKGKNILNYKAQAHSLSNGNKFIRVRHRDRNLEWSEWSDPVAFEVINSNKDN